MDNAFALRLILKAEQDNALHKRSPVVRIGEEGRQSPLMSLLQMSRLYLYSRRQLFKKDATIMQAAVAVCMFHVSTEELGCVLLPKVFGYIG